MYRSNINQKSNVYIRAPETYSDERDAPEEDGRFIGQIFDKAALEIFQKHTDLIMKDFNISELQRQILEDVPCGLNSSGEIARGVVRENGELAYQCRCEAKECPQAESCGRRVINRDTGGETAEPLEKPLEMLGVDEKTNVFADPDGDEPEDEGAFSEEEAAAVAELLRDSADYTEISAEQAAKSVVEAGLDERMIVNAAPGAGKTYTAAERLMYLCEKTPKILVLCCTDSAADEIKARVEAKAAGAARSAASLTALGTFDVLATKYLADKGVPTEELCGMSYDERIRVFNERMHAEDFADFEYCIIDELQELVNERAEMALKILGSLKCGFLLLEDRFQAVFDHGCPDGGSMSFVGFYAALRELLPRDARKFTLVGNKRQSESLEQMTGILRSGLLEDDPKTVSDVCRKQLSELPKTLVSEDFKITADDGTAAILCLKNGDAEYISWLLHKNKIPHTLIRENVQGASLGRGLAEILWDHHDRIITRDSFVKRFTARCGGGAEQAAAYFAELCGYLANGAACEAESLDCELLAEKICQGGELPAKILNSKNSALTVSAIRKAKGREFDKVYLLGYDFAPKESGSARDEKMLYLAETRPKNELEILSRKSKWVFKRNKNNRWIRTVREAYKRQSVCVGFGTGDTEDLDYSSFVEGGIADAIRRQAYISRSVRCGDEVELRLCGGIYEIIHSGNVIGKMSASYSENLLDEFNGRRYLTELPEKITELFVTNVITFVSYKDYENIPAEFRKKRFWLGVEISGFGVIQNPFS